MTETNENVMESAEKADVGPFSAGSHVQNTLLEIRIALFSYD